jgi:hypothetical protein
VPPRRVRPQQRRDRSPEHRHPSARLSAQKAPDRRSQVPGPRGPAASSDRVLTDAHRDAQITPTRAHALARITARSCSEGRWRARTEVLAAVDVFLTLSPEALYCTLRDASSSAPTSPPPPSRGEVAHNRVAPGPLGAWRPRQDERAARESAAAARLTRLVCARAAAGLGSVTQHVEAGRPGAVPRSSPTTASRVCTTTVLVAARGSRRSMRRRERDTSRGLFSAARTVWGVPRVYLGESV